MGDRGGLEAVELVEDVVDGGVGDEMIDIVVVGSCALGFVDERGGAREGVVDVADEFGVREGFAS